jgi:hypothetical protein
VTDGAVHKHIRAVAQPFGQCASTSNSRGLRRSSPGQKLGDDFGSMAAPPPATRCSASRNSWTRPTRSFSRYPRREPSHGKENSVLSDGDGRFPANPYTATIAGPWSTPEPCRTAPITRTPLPLADNLLHNQQPEKSGTTAVRGQRRHGQGPLPPGTVRREDFDRSRAHQRGDVPRMRDLTNRHGWSKKYQRPIARRVPSLGDQDLVAALWLAANPPWWSPGCAPSSGRTSPGTESESASEQSQQSCFLLFEEAKTAQMRHCALDLH